MLVTSNVLWPLLSSVEFDKGFILLLLEDTHVHCANIHSLTDMLTLMAIIATLSWWALCPIHTPSPSLKSGCTGQTGTTNQWRRPTVSLGLTAPFWPMSLTEPWTSMSFTHSGSHQVQWSFYLSNTSGQVHSFLPSLDEIQGPSCICFSFDLFGMCTCCPQSLGESLQKWQHLYTYLICIWIWCKVKGTCKFVLWYLVQFIEMQFRLDGL